MSMLNIAKKLKRIKSKLTESKADTQRLIDFAGQDLADRFLKIKDKLKAPKNDLYYWIKNKTPADLEQTIINAETSKSKSVIKKEISEQGARLVCDSAHWRVYHITTFEASQKYGRDTKWCITGVDDYGDQYWNDYTQRGVEFYFAITKENYDLRGEDSKFAFAIFPGEYHIELYNQQNGRVALIDVPYYDEINIPGIDLDNVTEEDYTYTCDLCGCEVGEDELYTTPDGECCCEDCFCRECGYCEDCEEVFWLSDLEEINGKLYCKGCAQNHEDEQLETRLDKAIANENERITESLSVIDEFRLYEKLWG